MKSTGFVNAWFTQLRSSCSPLLTALVIVAPKFVTWFYGPAWSACVVPVQILAIGGGAMLVVEAVTVTMLATGRARAVMWWGWGHFMVYGAAVFAVSGLGLTAIAVAAAAVHGTCLIISYLQLHHGRLRRGFETLAKDVLPAAASSLGLAAVALPASVFASTLDIPMLLYLLLIALAGGAGYFLSLRLCFSGRAPSARPPSGALASVSRASPVWSVHLATAASISCLAPAGSNLGISMVKRKSRLHLLVAGGALLLAVTAAAISLHSFPVKQRSEDRTP